MKPVLTTALLLSVLTTAGIAAAERPSVSTPERFARDLQRVRVEVAKPAHDRVATPAAVSHAPRPAALARVTNAGGQIDRAERNHVSRASSASRAAGAAVPQARTPKAGGEVCKPGMNCAEGTGSSRSQSSARAHGAAAQGLAFGAKGTTIEQMRGKEVSKRLLERMRGAMAAHAAAAGHMVDPGSSLREDAGAWFAVASQALHGFRPRVGV